MFMSPLPAIAACCLAIMPNSAPRTDGFGDALPPGATARLGTIRWRLDGPLTSVAVPPDGKTVVVAGDGTVRLWDLATGRELRRLVCRPRGRSDVRLLPDGKTLVVTDSEMFGNDAVIRLWDLEEWKKLPKWVRPKEPAYGCFVLSPDGTTLAVSTGEGATVLRDARTGEERCRLEKPGMTRLVFSPDGKTVASDAGADIQLWDAETGRKLRLLRGHDDVHWGGVACVNPIDWIAFSPDGRKLVSASMDRSVIVWDAAAGKELHRLDERVRPKYALGQHLFFSPDGETLVVPGDGVLYLCDAASGRLVREVPTRGEALGFTPDGKTLVLGGAVLRLVDVTTSKDVLPAFGGHEADLRLLRFLPDGKTVLTAGYDDTVRLWDAAGRQLRRFETNSAGMGTALSPDGRVLALAGWKGDVNLWDVTKGERLRGWPADARSLDVVAFSPDAKTLATGGLDQRMHLWDAATGAERWQTEDQGMGIYEIAFSPDGRRLAAVVGRMSDGAGGRVVHLFDAGTGKEVGKFEGPHEKIYHLAFSPDGKTLAAAGYKEPIRLWETATGGERAKLPVADGSADDLAFSPDGRLMAVAQYERPTRLLDVLSGEEVGAFDGGGSEASRVAFSPDGRTLATSEDTSALIWPLTGPAAARHPEADGLSADQRETAWEDLADADAARAYLAMRALADDPERSPGFLQERLEENADAARRMHRLIAGLDNDDFDEREQAEAELRRMGRTAEAALRQTLRSPPSAEVRMRAERLTQHLEPEDALSPAALRGSRALEALERMGDGRARQTLEALATRAKSSRVREEANLCLKRLTGRVAP
jgi:WD40 repeat protein